MFNFTLHNKNRTSCREGLRLDSFNEKSPTAQKPRCSAGSPACSLCQRSRGKSSKSEVQLSQLLCSFPLFTLLAPLCIFLLLHLFPLSPPTWLASSLSRPARPSLSSSLMCHFSFFSSRELYSLTCTAYLQVHQDSQTFLGIALRTRSHLYPLSTKPQTLKKWNFRDQLDQVT